MSNDDFRDPDEETGFGQQGDKETLGATSRNEPPPWNEGDRLKDFVLEKLLGSGSSGFVFRALDVKTNRRCALKLLKQGPPDDLLRNKLGFRRMMSLEHPNLLRVDRIYQLGSYIALSMEEVVGQTLGCALRGYKRLDSRLAYSKLLGLMRDYASGLAMMHANGLIHRDVKPENLMVDDRGRGRVIDYGLVDSFDLDQPSYGARGYLVGTPHYFSPEAIWSQRYLPAGDIFSLGIVMLDALRAVKNASAAKSSVERCRRSQQDDAERIDEAIQELADSVPDIIRDACREMLDRQPSERPTAMELARLGLSRTQPVLWPHKQPIIGREAEQREIFSWLDGIFDGDVGRLHLTGPSGIGKTRLVEEIVEYIENKNWGQLFCARCRVREDQPLQAFDQICDAITNRYMQGDRERLELDPVSAEMLQGIFPVLRNILTCSMQLAPAAATTERLDALEAGARMSQQLRLVGPLFFIIDDSQWADRDSLNVLDRLQTAVGDEGLGIITISRDEQDPQRIPASKHIHLGPLQRSDSVDILARAARRWSVDVSDSVLDELAVATGGSPFRLRELADEFRPGGVLAELSTDGDSSVTQFGQIHCLWHKRFERLSNEAQSVLAYVVTAGGRVSTQQLGELTRLGDSVDAAVSELARQRLITDEATGGECILIFHDHVADELIKTLGDETKRKAHHDWASLLVRQDNPQRLAARIAGHFFAAGQPGRAVAHAILAAEDAERLMAKTEAARWYARVIDYVDGQEKIDQIRNAARCYKEADFPVEAAEHYQQLAKFVEEEERIECHLLATTLLIRSGRCSLVCEQLRDLADTLGLPKPKSPWLSRLSLVIHALRLARHGKNPLLSRLTGHDCDDRADGSSKPTVSAHGPTKLRRQQQRLKLCLALVRPMSVFDSLYAAELSLAGSLLSLHHGSEEQRIHFIVGDAVFACYDKGLKRIEAETNLLELRSHIEDWNNPRATADLWAGIAHSHALACRWDQTCQPVQTSVEHYQMAGDSLGFELAHTRWIELWAAWHLGRWDRMQQDCEEMFADAIQRNDLFQQIMTSGGFSGAAWLAADKASQLHRLRAENAVVDCETNRVQMFHVLDWITSIQCLLYEGKFAQAWAEYQSMVPVLNKMPYAKMQLARVSRQLLGVVAALNQFASDGSEQWIAPIRSLTHQLRHERIGFARVLANLYDGLLLVQMTKRRPAARRTEEARQLLLQAVVEARHRRLRPYQLAAEDALAEIQTGHSLGLLADRMSQHRVVRPDRLQRLYTVPADSD